MTTGGKQHRTHLPRRKAMAINSQCVVAAAVQEVPFS